MIWYKAASPPLHSAHPSPETKRHLDMFIHFCTAHGRVSSGMSGHVLFPKNWLFTWGIWTSSNAWFLGPNRVHNLNGISIGSAVFTGFTVERPYSLQSSAPSPKIAHSHGGSRAHRIHGCLGPPVSSTQTASRSVQPFLQGTVTDRQTTIFGL